MYGTLIRPSRLGYWLAAALAALAVACAILAVLSFLSLSRQVSSFQRVPVPGQGTVTFTGPGGYLIYFEGPGLASASSTGLVRVALQSQADGQQVPISPLRAASETYTMAGHSGRAVAAFTIVRPGTYELSAGLPDGPAPADLAVGHGIGGGVARAVTGITIGVLALIASITAGVITGVRRGLSRRRALLPGPQAMQPGMSWGAVMPGVGPVPPQPPASPPIPPAGQQSPF
jgi:hypothetical protein